MVQTKILLHICCAPCSSAAIRELRKLYEVVLFFFNPNIYPKNEHDMILLEATRLAIKEDIEIIKAGYDHESFLSYARPLASEKEGGNRCRLCYEDRLKRTAMTAKDKGIGTIATTLTLSPHKDASTINEIGRKVCENTDISYFDSDFKKKGGYNYSIEYSRSNSLIRQDYCGCEFSRRSIESPKE